MGRSANEEQDFAQVTKMGEALAAEVLRSAKAMPAGRTNRDPIRHTASRLRFQNRWEKEKSIEVGITTVLINREIAIAAVPGEPLVKLQRIWKEQAGVPYPLFYGYTFSNGGVWPGYLPDIKSAANGGYGADAATSIEVGAGETIMNRHLVNLYGLFDMWRDKPGRN
jgi:hypothetical protein